jgi:predicted  nucleic acid-binding Zn-ribbon protein
MAEHTEILARLAQVRDLDARLHAEATRLEECVRECAAREAGLARAEKAVEDGKAGLRQAQAAHRELEDMLQGLDARIRKLETEGGVAGMAAVEKHRAEVSHLEDEGLALMDTITGHEQKLAQIQSALEQARQQLEDARDRRAKQTELERQTRAEVEPATQAMLSELNEGAQQAYADALARNPGAPLADIVNGFCGGCQGELPPQQAVQAAREITACPYCDRILLPPVRE